MPPRPVEPGSCPECGHAVYRPLLLPVRRAAHLCRAILSGPGPDVRRCGCSHPVHHAVQRPRHRRPVGEAATDADGPR